MGWGVTQRVGSPLGHQLITHTGAHPLARPGPGTGMGMGQAKPIRLPVPSRECRRRMAGASRLQVQTLKKVHGRLGQKPHGMYAPAPACWAPARDTVPMLWDVGWRLPLQDVVIAKAKAKRRAVSAAHLHCSRLQAGARSASRRGRRSEVRGPASRARAMGLVRPAAALWSRCSLGSCACALCWAAVTKRALRWAVDPPPPNCAAPGSPGPSFGIQVSWHNSRLWRLWRLPLISLRQFGCAVL